VDQNAAAAAETVHCVLGSCY